MIPLPQNLPLLLARSTPDQRRALESVWNHPDDIQANLLELGRHWKVRVTFSKPVEIHGIPHWTRWKAGEDGRLTKSMISGDRTGTEHIFAGFFLQGSLCYRLRRDGRRGYYFPSLELVTGYEPVPESARVNVFSSYEEFRAKFDRMFITDAEIQKLWNDKSSQHGGQYRPSDFHRIGKVGKDVLKRFLTRFKGVSSKDYTGYVVSNAFKNQTVYVLEERHDAYHHSGRDIRISHQSNCDFVYYASEYQGYGNGRYGLVANKNEFLWLEDD